MSLLSKLAEIKRRDDRRPGFAGEHLITFGAGALLHVLLGVDAFDQQGAHADLVIELGGLAAGVGILELAGSQAGLEHLLALLVPGLAAGGLGDTAEEGATDQDRAEKLHTRFRQVTCEGRELCPTRPRRQAGEFVSEYISARRTPRRAPPPPDNRSALARKTW